MSGWCTDQAGPFQTIAYAGSSCQPQGKPACQPHEYIRNGTVNILTLFHPWDGQVRVRGVTTCPNAVLPSWLKQQLSAMVASLPPASSVPETEEPALRACWERWQAGLKVKPTLAQKLPPLGMLLILDTLAGHWWPEWV